MGLESISLVQTNLFYFVLFSSHLGVYDLLAAYIAHTDCQKHDMGNHHPECPERLGAVNDQLLMKGLLDYMNQLDAPLATTEQLARVHSASYLQEFAEIAQRVPQGGHVQIDPDTISMNFLTKRLYARQVPQ